MSQSDRDCVRWEGCLRYRVQQRQCHQAGDGKEQQPILHHSFPLKSMNGNYDEAGWNC
jgi:hypothetical protein